MRSHRSVFWSTVRPGLRQVNLAGKHCVLFYGKPSRSYIARQVRSHPQFDPAARLNIANKAPNHNYVSR